MMTWLTQVADFMPHGMCLQWRPQLMALHIISDALIAAAYFAIPLALAVFVAKRQDLNGQHRALAILFALFITACGLTHVMSIVVLWRPYYVAEGVLKAITALVSVGTACILPFLIPKLLQIPSPKTLAAEIASHKQTLASLEAARKSLAHRVLSTEGDLLETTRRFEAAIRSSPITLFEQDQQLLYTWVYNPPNNVDPMSLVGRTARELFPGGTAEALDRLQVQALGSNEPARGEVHHLQDGLSQWYDVRIEPMTRGDGLRGLIATAVDITALKLNQERLQLLMRELNHRSKNLLTIVVSIARQTARGFAVPKEFTARLQERLSSLASAHDVLAHEDWRGADMDAILRGQLKHQFDTFADRVDVVGPPFKLPPEAAHYVGMALHELGSNAVKYGALSGEHGSVSISWEISLTDAPEFIIDWIERGGPTVSSVNPAGFGSTILTRLAPGALSGSAVLSFDPAGAQWRLRAPLPGPGSQLHPTASDAPPP